MPTSDEMMRGALDSTSRMRDETTSDEMMRGALDSTSRMRDKVPYLSADDETWASSKPDGGSSVVPVLLLVGAGLVLVWAMAR